MGRTSSGLPGQNVGAKAHGYFMYGNADAFCGRKHMDVKKAKLSKACAKAYEQGWTLGLKQRPAPKKAHAVFTLPLRAAASANLEQAMLTIEKLELRPEACSTFNGEEFTLEDPAEAKALASELIDAGIEFRFQMKAQD